MTIVSVPGAFEIPQAARRLAEAGGVDAVVCLGCLIRGETPHFEYLAAAVAHGFEAGGERGKFGRHLMRLVGLLGDKYQLDELLAKYTFTGRTRLTVEQAIERARPGPDNKGWEAAAAAVEMARLFHRLGAVGAGGRDP